MIVYTCGAGVRRWFHLYSLAKDEVSEGEVERRGEGKGAFLRVYLVYNVRAARLIILFFTVYRAEGGDGDPI